MATDADEWMKQARYDMKTAEVLQVGRRYSYVLFMCHLSIEKALKGIYMKTLGVEPPKLHSLVYFVERLQLPLPEAIYDAVFDLNRVSTQTRYPEDIQRLVGALRKTKAAQVLQSAKKVLRWLLTEYSKR